MQNKKNIYYDNDDSKNFGNKNNKIPGGLIYLVSTGNWIFSQKNI